MRGRINCLIDFEANQLHALQIRYHDKCLLKYLCISQKWSKMINSHSCTMSFSWSTASLFFDHIRIIFFQEHKLRSLLSLCHYSSIISRHGFPTYRDNSSYIRDIKHHEFEGKIVLQSFCQSIGPPSVWPVKNMWLMWPGAAGWIEVKLSISRGHQGLRCLRKGSLSLVDAAVICFTEGQRGSFASKYTFSHCYHHTLHHKVINHYCHQYHRPPSWCGWQQEGCRLWEYNLGMRVSYPNVSPV